MGIAIVNRHCPVKYLIGCVVITTTSYDFSKEILGPFLAESQETSYGCGWNILHVSASKEEYAKHISKMHNDYLDILVSEETWLEKYWKSCHPT